ncbi:MAG: glycosyltransferase, partial [Actinobacteria bacterium]|nr:glycosyltransferase [Actinomycetota bacterium]
MRILVVTPQPPWPPNHGAAMRNSLLVQVLGARHEVDIVTLAWPDEPAPADVPGARRTIAVVHRPSGLLRRGSNLLTGRAPDLVFRHMGRPLRAVVQQRLVSDRYDAVQLEGLQLAHLAHDVRLTFAGTRDRPAIVYDAHNVEWRLQRAIAGQARGWRARYAHLQATRLRTVEDQTLAAADLTIASTADDCAALAALPSAMRIVHVPHPIAVADRAPAGPPEDAPPCVLLAANFAYRPNLSGAIWLFGQVWPRVLQHRPHAQLRVVGRASERLRLLAPARTSIGGAVDNVQAEYAAAWLAVSPVPVGAGAPYKVLHA